MLRLLIFTSSILLWIASGAVGQTPRHDSISTYLPIWQRTEDLNDNVSPKRIIRRFTSDVPNDLSLVRRPTVLNLFAFPPDSVTYLINEQVYTDTSRVRQVLADPKKRISELSIGKQDGAGKRIIRIRYE